MSRRQPIYVAIVLFSLLLATAGAVLAFVVAPKATVTNVASAHLRAAAAIIVAMTSLGGSVLFLTAIGRFRTRMRIAYSLFAAGIILFGLALVQLPVIGFRDLWNSWWANSGMVIAPFIFATVLIYAGMQRFALLLGIKQAMTKWWLLFTTAAVGTVVSFVGGHYLARFHTIAGTDMYIAIVAWSAICITFATSLARMIVGRIGPLYHDAMRWLLIALICLTFAAWHEYLINYFMDNDSWYVAYGLSFWPFILSGLTMLRAGYAFTRLGAAIPYIPVHEAPGESNELAYADSLASLVALVSAKDNPVAKDVQATIASSPSTNRLVQSYSKLEHYLVHEDPLRSYARRELRERLQPGFRTLVERNHQ